MYGLGTIINVAAIAGGGLLGMFAGKLIPEHLRESLIMVCSVSVLFIAAAGVLQKMFIITDGGLETQGTLMMMLCLAFGTVAGELLRLDERLESFGEWLKKKTGSSKDGSFVTGFVTASLTVSIGAMAIVGAIEDGINKDPSILIAKAILDFIIVLVMAASMGKGCIFSAIPVGVLQGSVTALAHVLSPLMTQKALDNISLVGSVLIFCVGLNLMREKKIRVANMLPSLILAIAAAFL